MLLSPDHFSQSTTELAGLLAIYLSVIGPISVCNAPGTLSNSVDKSCAAWYSTPRTEYVSKYCILLGRRSPSLRSAGHVCRHPIVEDALPRPEKYVCEAGRTWLPRARQQARPIRSEHSSYSRFRSARRTASSRFNQFGGAVAVGKSDRIHCRPIAPPVRTRCYQKGLFRVQKVTSTASRSTALIVELIDRTHFIAILFALLDILIAVRGRGASPATR